MGVCDHTTPGPGAGDGAGGRGGESMSDGCPTCDGWDHPCAGCRRTIHESWHKIGMGWVRSEECHPKCPGRLKEEAERVHADPLRGDAGREP